jgi:hypothetical protein
MEMTGNVFLYFYLLASALQLKTPLPPFFPQAEKTRKALMKRLQQLPTVMERGLQKYNLTEEKKYESYMVYYAYVVLMESIIKELEEVRNLLCWFRVYEFTNLYILAWKKHEGTLWILGS